MNMIKLNGNDIMRDEVKIGWIMGDHIFDHDGKKLGYTTSDTVFDEMAKKIAHLEGEFIYYPDTDKRTRLEDIINTIESPTLSDIQRVAVRIFFGN
jgi:hypothetical protein